MGNENGGGEWGGERGRGKFDKGYLDSIFINIKGGREGERGRGRGGRGEFGVEGVGRIVWVKYRGGVTKVRNIIY